MSTIRALKGAFTGRLSLRIRPAPHVAFRPHVSSRPYSDEPLKEWNTLEEYFNDQPGPKKPKSQAKRQQLKRTKAVEENFDDEFSKIFEPKPPQAASQAKPVKPWLKKREEARARSKAPGKADERRSRKTARNIARLEQEIRNRHATGRPDITSAIDPERSEITIRSAQEAIARWNEMKEQDRNYQGKETRAVRALKRDIKRQAKEARIFMASQAQTAEKAWENEFEQIEKEKNNQGNVAQSVKHMSELLSSVSSEPVTQEVSFTPQQEKSPVSKRNTRATINSEERPEVSERVIQAQSKPAKSSPALPAQEQKHNAIRTAQGNNDPPEETAENEEDWEDEVEDEEDADWLDESGKKKKPNKKERRRLKLQNRFKESLQKKMGIPVGDTTPHPEIDAKCAEWMARRIKQEQDREKRKKKRMKKSPPTHMAWLVRKERKGRND